MRALIDAETATQTSEVSAILTSSPTQEDVLQFTIAGLRVCVCVCVCVCMCVFETMMSQSSVLLHEVVVPTTTTHRC